MGVFSSRTNLPGVQEDRRIGDTPSLSCLRTGRLACSFQDGSAFHRRRPIVVNPPFLRPFVLARAGRWCATLLPMHSSRTCRVPAPRFELRRSSNTRLSCIRFAHFTKERERSHLQLHARPCNLRPERKSRRRCARRSVSNPHDVLLEGAFWRHRPSNTRTVDETMDRQIV